MIKWIMMKMGIGYKIWDNNLILKMNYPWSFVRIKKLIRNILDN